MRKLKKALALICSLTFVLQAGISSASASYQTNSIVGGVQTLHYTDPQTRGWDSGDQITYANSAPSYASSANSRWGRVRNSETIYRSWETYKVDDSDELSPSNEGTWGNSGVYGYFPRTVTYRIPINSDGSGYGLRTDVDSFLNAFDRLGFYTIFNTGGNNPLYYGVRDNNTIHMGSRDFFGIDGAVGNTFRLGNNTYDSILEMYLAADASQRSIIIDCLREALEKMGYDSAEIQNMINQLQNAAQTGDSLAAQGWNNTQIKTYLIQQGFISSSLNGLLFGGFISLLGPAPNTVSTDDFADFIERWLFTHNGALPEGFDGSDTQTQVFWLGGPRGFSINGNATDSLLPDGTFYTVPYSYYYQMGIDDTSDLVHFGQDLINGGVYDARDIHNRIGIVDHVLRAYETLGVDTVDVTRVLDYRIKSLWIGAGEKDTLTHKYMWTIEKKDADGSFTLYPLANSIAGTLTPMKDFYFRPTSVGTYKITCYPEYTTTTVNKVAAYATEYAYLTDTGNVFLMDQNFQGDTVPSLDGNTHSMIDEEIETGEATGWNWDGSNADVNTTDPNAPRHQNEYAQTWVIDVDDGMIDQTIIDLNSGTIRMEFDTERIE